MSTTPLIAECQNIGLRYGNGPEILCGVNLKIAEGDFIILTGQSGAGKTSLLNILSLVLRPGRGLLTLLGYDCAGLPARVRARVRRQIGVVWQDFRLLDHLTAYENITLPLYIAGRRMRSYRRDIVELLDWVGLAGLENAYPPTLSGGEKQRAAIARAVAARPALLIADEPAAHVDPAMGARLMQLFTELNRLGTTVIIATHAPRRALYPQARFLHLHEGKIHEGKIHEGKIEADGGGGAQPMAAEALS